MLTLLIVLLVLAFVAGSPLFAVMLFLTAICAMAGAQGFEKDFGGFAYEFFSLGTGDKSTIFSSIPLFIYAGYIMAASKTAERLVRFANAALGWCRVASASSRSSPARCTRRSPAPRA